MADGREERDEQEKRREWEEQKKGTDPTREDPRREDPFRPERRES